MSPIKNFVASAVAGGLLLTSGVALAGSYPVNCDVKAEKDKKKYSLSAEHFSQKAPADFGQKPYNISLSVDDKAMKLKTKKKMGGLWFIDFGDVHVVYSGTNKESLERWAFFYAADGDYIARVQCK